jgi:hypothetical protein
MSPRVLAVFVWRMPLRVLGLRWDSLTAPIKAPCLTWMSSCSTRTMCALRHFYQSSSQHGHDGRAIAVLYVEVFLLSAGSTLQNFKVLFFTSR